MSIKSEVNLPSVVPRLKPLHKIQDLKWVMDFNRAAEAEFKLGLSKITGLPYIHLLPYGRTAFWVAAKALLRPSDAVLMPAYNCKVVSDALVVAGQKLGFADVQRGDANFDLKLLEDSKYKNKFRTLVNVHMYGNTSNPVKVQALAKELGMEYVITDAALALFSSHEGKHVAQYGDATVLSFSTGKHLSLIEGGALLTQDSQMNDKFKKVIAENVRPPSILSAHKKFAFFMSVLATYDLGLYGAADYLYNRTDLLNFLAYGLKSEKIEMPKDFLNSMSEMQIRMGLPQLTKIKEIRDKRKALQDVYHGKLSKMSLVGVSGLSALVNESVGVNALSHYSILVEDRPKFFEKLRKEKIYLENGIFEYSLDELPQYKEHCVVESVCENARFIAKHVVNLPLYPELKIETAERIADLCLK